jgi:hypothetical protein
MIKHLGIIGDWVIGYYLEFGIWVLGIGYWVLEDGGLPC